MLGGELQPAPVDPLLDSRRTMFREAIEQGGGTDLHHQQPAVLRSEKAFPDGVVEKRDQVLEVSGHVQEATRLLVKAELGPGEHLEELLPIVNLCLLFGSYVVCAWIAPPHHSRPELAFEPATGTRSRLTSATWCDREAGSGSKPQPLRRQVREPDRRDQPQPEKKGGEREKHPGQATHAAKV